MAQQIETADVLVARSLVAATGVGIASSLVLVALDRVRLDRRSDGRDHLLGDAAIGRGERLPLAVAGIHRLGETHPLPTACRHVRCDEVRDLDLEWDLEG